MNPEGKGRADHLAKAKPKTGVAVRSGMENWVTVADGLRSIWHKREKQPVDAFGTRSRGRMPRAVSEGPLIIRLFGRRLFRPNAPAGPNKLYFPLIWLVGAAGFEPATR